MPFTELFSGPIYTPKWVKHLRTSYVCMRGIYLCNTETPAVAIMRVYRVGVIAAFAIQGFFKGYRVYAVLLRCGFNEKRRGGCRIGYRRTHGLRVSWGRSDQEES